MRSKKVIAIVCGLLGGVLILELAVRIFGLAPQVMKLEIGGANYDIREGVYELSLNPKEIYRPKPNSGDTNKFGYRGPPYDDWKFKTGDNFIFLGDSVTYGIRVAYEDTFTYRLQKIFEREGIADDNHIFNLGVPGYSFLQQVERFKLLGLKMRPRAVIFTMCYNDLDYSSLEIRNFDVLAQAHPNAVMAPQAGIARGPARLHETLLNSAIYRALYFADWKPDNSARRLGKRGDDLIPDDEVKAAVNEMIDLSKKHGFVLKFIMMPAQDPHAWDKPGERVRAMIGHEYLHDLNAIAFKNWKDEDHRKFFLSDWHYNEEGHRRIAEMLWTDFAYWRPHKAPPKP